MPGWLLLPVWRCFADTVLRWYVQRCARRGVGLYVSAVPSRFFLPAGFPVANAVLGRPVQSGEWRGSMRFLPGWNVLPDGISSSHALSGGLLLPHSECGSFALPFWNRSSGSADQLRSDAGFVAVLPCGISRTSRHCNRSRIVCAPSAHALFQAQ